ncbi:hypothetical protein N7535_008842 [Penicillium sp. DV-2018c]|nr:hypothetical protein N7461_002597 [Penicillium sp. DV-2018c]KAJ5563678.1 hypothetical protein N7535_008842 [Penicillium sp. DV-2018c]
MPIGDNDQQATHLGSSETTPLLRNTVSHHASYNNIPHIGTDSESDGEEPLIRCPSNAGSVPPGLQIESSLEIYAAKAGAPGAPGDHSNISSRDEGDQGSRFIDISPARFWVIFGGIMMGYMIGFFDSTLMASSHPVITSYFNAANSASWLSTAFLLTSTAFMPLLGRASDAFGRKPVYLFAIVMFFLTTAACGLAPNMATFITARALCGLGAGGIFSMGQIISSDLVRLEYRGVYQSYINLCLGIGGSFGLAFGGFLCDHIGWRGAFFIQLPFIFVYMIAAALTVPANLGVKRTGDERMKFWQLVRSIDITGSIILIVCVTSLIVGLNFGGNVFPWSHPLIIASLVASLVLGVILVFYERQVPRPVLPIELMSKNPRASIIFGNFFASMSVNTVIFNAPLYFQAVKLATPTASGLCLLGTSVALTVSSVSTGFLVNWTRRLKPFVMTGIYLMVVGGCAAASMGIDTPQTISLLCISISSFGQGFAFPSLMVSILATSEQKDQAVATTTLGLWRNLGSVMGVAVSSWIFQNSLIYELDQKVTGVDKSHVIALVRKSVQSIAHLSPLHRREVTMSYSAALRLTFLSAAVCASISLLLLFRVRLPRLGKRA